MSSSDKTTNYSNVPTNIRWRMSGPWSPGSFISMIGMSGTAVVGIGGDGESIVLIV